MTDDKVEVAVVGLTVDVTSVVVAADLLVVLTGAAAEVEEVFTAAEDDAETAAVEEEVFTGAEDDDVAPGAVPLTETCAYSTPRPLVPT